MSPAAFPEVDSIRIRMPLIGEEMTIWPGPKETYWDWVVGFPLEIHPFAWDYLLISCDGNEVEIQPHYLESTWDTFWTNESGHVTAHALGGLFPYTLGEQVDLLEGIVATLAVLPALIVDDDPVGADKIQQIHDILVAQDASTAIGPDPAEDMSFLRRSASDFVWRRKLRRLTRNRDDEEPRSR
jgi:hypothetical protein